MANIDKKELHSLFQELKQGKQEAAQELYEKYKSLVYGIAFSIVKNKDDSEDIVQNTFKKIIETEANKLPKNYEATWIYIVTKNEAIQFLQKKGKHINIEDIYNIQDNNNEIAKIIDSEVYNKIISKLSKKEKEIISLKVIGGLSFTQIGKLLGENTNTTKWRYYSAIYKLKVVLSNISIAIISAIIGIATYKKEKTANQIIETNSINSINDTYSIEKGNRESDTKSEMQDRINDETDWNINKNTVNNITNEVNEILQVEDKTEQEPERNYLSYGFVAFTIILLIVTIIIIIKHQPNRINKPSK